MNKIAVIAVINELNEIQERLPESAGAKSRLLISDRISQYRERKESAPSSRVTNTDHARADILKHLETYISEQKQSPLSKGRLADTILRLAKARREAASGSAHHVNHEAHQAVVEELVHLRTMLTAMGLTLPHKLLNERLKHHVQLHAEHFKHPPVDIAEAQADVLTRFSEYVSQGMKAPLRKKDITNELSKWETFARYGQPLPDKRSSPNLETS